MQLQQALVELCQEALEAVYGRALSEDAVVLQPTRKEFRGDFTLVTFSLARPLGQKPPVIADSVGRYLKAHSKAVAEYEVVKGFLNLELSHAYWGAFLDAYAQADLAKAYPSRQPQTVMVEYSSPNSNKPLHLGHIRNNLLGYSLSEVLKARHHEVVKANLINDRGIHICKSMLAYREFGRGETPQQAGLKGDHLVGSYYVQFEKAYQEQKRALVAEWARQEPELAEVEDPPAYLRALEKKGKTEALSEAEKRAIQKLKALDDKAEREAPLMRQAQQMLHQWEQGEPEVVALWHQMNQWVYEGFEQTYARMGVDFDRYYYESETYLLGKDIVQEGLDKGLFYRKEDGSVWADLTDEGLDEKLLLRSDGTSVYITQDLGTAELKYRDYRLDQSIYVVGNEQEYHFKVLQALLKRLERPYAEGVYHLSYGMVDLPTGKMKTREGTVVDADDLMAEVEKTAARYTEESGKIADLGEEARQQLYQNIGLGALKFFLLKTEPKKRLLFNPEEEIDFQGHTGPFVQYTHARIASVLRKSGQTRFPVPTQTPALQEEEIALLRGLSGLPLALAEAEKEMNPAAVAQYVFELAKGYNRFYHAWDILQEPDEAKRALRLALSQQTARTIAFGLHLLGIAAPEKM